eukprot:12096183-Ditylum_brightwellii.AAC.1
MPTSETNPSMKQSSNTMLRILLKISILLNHDDQVIQYNIHDPPQLTEGDEEDNEDQPLTEHDDDG